MFHAKSTMGKRFDDYLAYHQEEWEEYRWKSRQEKEKHRAKWAQKLFEDYQDGSSPTNQHTRPRP